MKSLKNLIGLIPAILAGAGGGYALFFMVIRTLEILTGEVK